MLTTRYLVLKVVTGKLKPRFVGSFQAEEQIGANAFKLTLPATMQIHRAFNVSLLWPYQGEYKPPVPIEIEGKAEYEVEKIIQHCVNGRRW